MTQHRTGTRAEWLAARLALREAEKALTRRPLPRGRRCRGSGSTRRLASRQRKGRPRSQISSGCEAERARPRTRKLHWRRSRREP